MLDKASFIIGGKVFLFGKFSDSVYSSFRLWHFKLCSILDLVNAGKGSWISRHHEPQSIKSFFILPTPFNQYNSRRRTSERHNHWRVRDFLSNIVLADPKPIETLGFDELVLVSEMSMEEMLRSHSAQQSSLFAIWVILGITGG
jgi:hypothetical protein